MNYFERGLLPGPKESQAAFLKRVQSIEKVEVPFSGWTQALEEVENLFGIRPDWIRVEEKGTSLSFWEAAATFETDQGPLILLPDLKRRKHLQKFVSFQEVCAHEMVHAVRCAFQESRFEEILAYQTVKKSWRKYFGSLWKKPKEMRVFLFLLVLSVAVQGLSLFCALEFYLESVIFLPWAFLSYAMIRLMYDLSVFYRCQKNLKNLTPRPLAIMLGLTDREIALFAKKDPAFIRAYREKQEQDLRWAQLPRFEA